MPVPPMLIGIENFEVTISGIMQIKIRYKLPNRVILFMVFLRYWDVNAPGRTPNKKQLLLFRLLATSSQLNITKE